MRIIPLLLFLITSICHGQNYILVGDTKYESTETISFPGFGAFSDLHIQFAKNNDGSGLIFLTKFTGSSSQFIGGTILIYLDNGSVLKCYDKGKRDYVNDMSTSIFNLTKQEIEILKESSIQSIRYTIKCLNTPNFPGCNESFLSENQLEGSERLKRHDTKTMINELFTVCYFIIGSNSVGEKIKSYPTKLINKNSFQEYEMGLSTNIDEKFISLIVRNNSLISSDNENLIGDLEIQLDNGTIIKLKGINFGNQEAETDVILMGIYYVEPSNLQMLMLNDIDFVKFHKVRKDSFYNKESITEEKIQLSLNRKLISKYLRCSIE
jgi:hypothetical protein